MLAKLLTVGDSTSGPQQWFLMTQCVIAAWFSFYSKVRDDARGGAEDFRQHVLFTQTPDDLEMSGHVSRVLNYGLVQLK